MALLSKKFRVLHYIIPFILVLVFFSFTGRLFKRAPWYEEMFWNVLTPPQHLFSAIGSGIGGAWNHYIALGNAARENEELRAKAAGLEAEVLAAREIEEENKRLRDLLGWHDRFPKRALVAQVISNDPRAEFKSIMINRGSKDGVEPLMPVLGPKGLVGKVGKTSEDVSRIILITDPNSAVDATVSRSRSRGMVVGSAWQTEFKPGYYLTRFEYLRGTSDILDEDVVVTSGIDGVFPPGVPIGTVHDIEATKYGVFRNANVVPFEDMAELKQVVVLLSKAEIER